MLCGWSNSSPEFFLPDLFRISGAVMDLSVPAEACLTGPMGIRSYLSKFNWVDLCRQPRSNDVLRRYGINGWTCIRLAEYSMPNTWPFNGF